MKEIEMDETFCFLKFIKCRLKQCKYAVRSWSQMFTATVATRSSATAEEPRDTLRQLKYYGRFFD